MKRHLLTVILVISAVVAAFFAATALEPRQAAAPTVQSGSGAAVVIPVNIISIDQHASTSPSISIEYPQFPSFSKEWNAAIVSSTENRLKQFNADVADNTKARGRFAGATPSAAIPMSAYTFIAAWQPAQITRRYVSFVEHYDSYSGGANGDQDVQTFNYDAAAKKAVTLDDLFGSVPAYLSKISILARTELIQSLGANSNGNIPTDMVNAGTEPVPDNFANFTFTDQSVTFYFPKYAVAPGSFGEQQVTFPRSSVR